MRTPTNSALAGLARKQVFMRAQDASDSYR